MFTKKLVVLARCREIDDRRTDHVSDPFIFKCFVLFLIRFFMELFLAQLAIQENKIKVESSVTTAETCGRLGRALGCTFC